MLRRVADWLDRADPLLNVIGWTFVLLTFAYLAGSVALR